MDRESGYFNTGKDAKPVKKTGLWNNLTLIRSSNFNRIYRFERDGKYFLLKIAGDTKHSSEILRREYDLSIGLDHPNIVNVYFYTQESPMGEGIVLEYIDGRTLSEFLSENPTKQQKEKIFGQLLDAISYLHGKQIIHNDLKPENILISRQNDNLKLIDFGLSDNDAHFQSKTPGCTPSYAAPELKDNRQSDVRSDIYSIGRLMQLIFADKYKRISAKCLSEKPEERYDTTALIKKWDNRNRNRQIVRNASMTIGILVLLGAFIIIAIRNDRENITDFKTSIALQNEEIESQKERYRQLEESYINVKDSLNQIRENIESHEIAKAEFIRDYQNGINRMISLSLDSIKNCKTIEEDYHIRTNFMNGVRRYYETHVKEVDNEDLSSQLFSIMTSEIERGYALFNAACPTMKES